MPILLEIIGVCVLALAIAYGVEKALERRDELRRTRMDIRCRKERELEALKITSASGGVGGSGPATDFERSGTQRSSSRARPNEANSKPRIKTGNRK